MKLLRFVLLLLFAITPLTTTAQPKELQHYSFIDYKANKIEYCGNSFNSFKKLYAKFVRPIKQGKGQVHILHIGDSHLQADFFSGRARANFQSILPGLQASRGMVSPFTNGCPDSYKLSYSPQWKHHNILSNNPQHNTFFANTVSTNAQSAEITIEVNNRNPVKYDFNDLRVYHSPLKEGDEISIDYPSYTKRHNENGYTLFSLNDYTDKITVRVNKSSDDTLYIYGFYFDNGDAGVVYNAIGVNSAEARHYINTNNDAILKTLHLDLIIISLGTNDCYEPGGVKTFEHNMETLIAKIRTQLPEVAILLTTPSDCWYKRKQINQNMQQACEQIKQVAQKNNCAVWDWYSIMGKKGSSTKWEQEKLMQKDKVHLTLSGYYLQGDMMYNALWEEIEKSIFMR